VDIKLAIIADDFTGSNDTGVQFSKKGLKTGVTTSPDDIRQALRNLDVLVVDTESRFDTGETAYKKVAYAAGQLTQNGISYIYKKLDSTFRGNIGAEISAAMDAAGASLAIVAPALPSNGRTTENSSQLVNGVPVAETEIGQDPRTPVRSSFIPDIISGQTDKRIGSIAIDDVRKGTENLLRKIIELQAERRQILVIDAITNEDLAAIAGAVPYIDEKVVLVGSAGFAEHLPEILGFTKKPAADSSTIFIVAGSVSDVTREQINFAKGQGIIEVIDVDLESIFTDSEEKELGRIIKKASSLAAEGKDIAIRSARTRELIDYARDLGKRQGLGSIEVSEKIARFLGKAAKEICSGLAPGGIMLTGGDVAIKSAEVMKISGILIKDEILPGVPFGYFMSEQYGHIPVVTKAGAFGKEDAVVKIIEFLKGRDKR